MISDQFLFAIQRSYNCAYPGCPTSKNEEDDFVIVRRQRLCSNVQCNFPRVTTRDVQIIAFSIFGPCCDDVIALALALQVGELWRQNLNLMRESTHFEGRRVNPGSEANF